MEDLPLISLRALAAVYSEGGVRPAARRLGVVHSSVARHLKELEDWLGITLRARSEGSRRLALTHEGRRLARTVLRALEEMESEVSSLRETRSPNSVVVGTVPSFAVRWLLPRLPSLERSHPHIEISVVVVGHGLGDPAAAGLDLAIRMGDGPSEGAERTPLADDALYPVMSESYWRRTGRPSKPGDLVGLRLLHDRDPQATWAIWRKEFGPADLDVARGPRLTSTDLVLRAAAQGQGVALARHRLAEPDIRSGSLLRPLGDVAVQLNTSYWIVRPCGTVSNSRLTVQAVVDWMLRQAELQPSADRLRS